MKHYIGHPSFTEDMNGAEKATYRFLDSLGIAYETICHRAAFTMEDCAEVREALSAPVCKNLFLCNRQQTQFYLFMLPSEKTFKAKSLSAELGCARLSFADENHMEDVLGLHPGAVSPMGLMNDKQDKVIPVADRELLTFEYIGCHPCVNTATLKLRTDDLLNRIIPATGHDCRVIDYLTVTTTRL